MARDTYVAAGVPGDRVHALPLGVDLATFRPASAPPAPKPFVFAFVGHFSYVKGFDLLMRATTGLAAERDFEIRVIGAGEHRLLDSGEPRVRWLGPLPPGDVARELALAHCLVLPSRLDSFGMVVPEALACGVPVIVSTNVGAKYLIAPDKNGWIVPAGDVPALQSRMRWCIDHPEELAAMRDACAATAARASWSNYRAAVRDLLPRLIPQSATASHRP